jgi:hypothetical protein
MTLMTISLPGIDSSTTFRAKRVVVEAGLLALGVAYEVLSKHSPEMRAEIADWSEGWSFSLGVLPRGPAVAIRKEADRLVYRGRGHHDADLQIWLKNVDSAVQVLTGLCAPHMAFAERRVVVHGPIDDSMRMYRTMGIVEKFLFPAVLLERLTKRPPTFTRQDLMLKARLYATLGPLLVASARR